MKYDADPMALDPGLEPMARTSLAQALTSVADPDPGSKIGFFQTPDPKPIILRAWCKFFG